MANDNNALVVGDGLGARQFVSDAAWKDELGNNIFRIFKRLSTQSSGDLIAFDSKLAARTSGTATVYGCQLSPRFNDGIAGASLVGAAFQPILKGSSGNLSGDVRGCQVDLTDDNAAGRTISGDVVAMRVFMQLAGHTISGDVAVLKVEAAGGATQWGMLAKLPDDGALAKSSQTAATQAGWIKVKVGSSTKYLPLYDSVS